MGMGAFGGCLLSENARGGETCGRRAKPPFQGSLGGSVGGNCPAVPLDALALALAAAVLHAGWNLLLARSRDTEAATALAVVVLVLAVSPVAALTWRVDGSAVPYIAASAGLELVYVALLAAAYRRFELSLVYPLARGLAPVLALLVVVVVTATRPSAGEIAGVLTVAAGVLLVRGLRGRGEGAALALVIAGVIAGYTVVDRYGIRHANAVAYLLLIMLGPALAYPPVVGWRRVRRELGLPVVAIGLASAGAYLLVLLALRLASAPSVAAVRESSVVIATAFAALVLRERVGARRLAGAVLVAGGIALLAVS
jgi:drug/metabolite transporter (DMT)-like permease